MNALEHARAEVNRQDALLQGIYEFIKDRTDDVAIGVGRIIQPIEVCSECGQENDYSQGKWCSCWSPVSEGDLGALRDMRVEIEEPDDDEEADRG